jgi:protein-S-isoprenylcysteine O-methyltransferase Ste14
VSQTILAIFIMLLVGFYWGRVIKLVLKQKKLGQSAHFFPPELVGKLIRVIWYPTVGVWALVPLLVAVWPDPPAFLRPMFHMPVVNWIAAGVSLVVLYLTMICWRRMGRDWRMGIDPEEKNNLIITGPYTYVRHPIYALQQLFAITTFLAVPVPAMLVVMILEIVLLSWEAIREEQHLIRQHGDTYRTYMQNSGRFIPKVV